MPLCVVPQRERSLKNQRSFEQQNKRNRNHGRAVVQGPTTNAVDKIASGP